MFLTITIVLSFVMIVMAIMAIQSKSIMFAVLAAGGVSLLASVLYLLLAAPDVALTEAAIGSGLTTVIFFFVLKKIKN